MGEPHDVMYRILDLLNGVMPQERPRYLMGVGYPPNIVEGIAKDMDIFDYVSLLTISGSNQRPNFMPKP